MDFLDLEHQLVSRAEIVLSSIVGFLTDRSIHVEQLRLLEKKRGRFLELCKIWDSHQKDKKISDKALLSLRACVVQVEKFDRAKRLVDKFVGACVSVCDPVNGVLSPELRLLSDRIKEDVSSMEVRGLCHFDSEEAAVEAFFHIPPSCRRYLQPIGNAVDSDIFMRIWNEHAREVGQQRCIEQPPNTNPLKLSEITELICAPVIGQWQRLCREVQDGSISLERVSTHFGCLTNDPRALTQEMDCISVCSPRRGNNAWKQQRQKQIEQYSRLTDKIEAARTLKNVLGTLEISQRFREVDIICKQVCSDTSALLCEFDRQFFLSRSLLNSSNNRLVRFRMSCCLLVNFCLRLRATSFVVWSHLSRRRTSSDGLDQKSKVHYCG